MMVAGKKAAEEAEEYKLRYFNMDITLIDQNKKNNMLTFLLSKADVVYANTLRRMMISEVPVMAIEDVEFKANNSALYDEMVAHRLGLISIKTDLKAYNLPSKCTCNGAGCARCQLKMTLSAEGPKTVYSKDIKSKDPKVKPVFDNIPIVKLLEGQSLEFEATAMLGLGKEHTKWSPSLTFYKNSPNLKVVKQPSDMDAFVNSCPKKVFEIKSGKVKVNDKNLYACDLCEACIDFEKGIVELSSNEDEFIFEVESWGQLEPKELVESAVDAFNDKLAELKKLIK